MLTSLVFALITPNKHLLLFVFFILNAFCLFFSFNSSQKCNLNQPVWNFLVSISEVNGHLGPLQSPKVRRGNLHDKHPAVHSPGKKMSWLVAILSFLLLNSLLAPPFCLQKPSILYNHSECPSSC